jgi:hypothetical protein
MLGPRLASHGDVVSRDWGNGKSTPSRLPGRNRQELMGKPIDTLDRLPLTIPKTNNFFLIFFEMENYLQSVPYLAMDQGK